eukprot:scaffold919_cov153-Ochromonas_danica.AAC.19
MSDDDEFGDAIEEEEEEIDEELALPSILSNISLADKKQLLLFKRSHNEREYEEEIERRIVPLQKKKQLEELRSMLGQEPSSSSTSAATATATATTIVTQSRGKTLPPPPAPQTRKKRAGRKGQGQLSDEEEKEDSDDEAPQAKRRATRAETAQKMKQQQLEEEEEEEEEEQSEDDEAAAASESEASFAASPSPSSDEDEDLFGSDEEAEISQRPSKFASKKGTKLLGQRRQAAARRRAREEEEEDYMDEEDVELDEEDLDAAAAGAFGEEDDQRFDYNLQSIKDSHRRQQQADKTDKAERAGKQREFSSLEEMRRHLELQDALRPSVGPEDNEPADLADYQRLTLRRDEIIRYMKEPFFEKFVVGALVRLSLPTEQGQMMYKLAEVLAVDAGRLDRLPATAFQPETNTNTRLTVRIEGQTRKQQRISQISNHSLKQQELDSFLRKEERLTKGDVKKRRARQKLVNSYSYSHEEIARMVRDRHGLNKAVVTDYSTAMESLVKRRDEAKATKDYDELEKLNKAIDKLESENQRQRDISERVYRDQVEVNRRMKEANVRRDMAAGMRKRQEDQEALARGIVSNAVADPFIRRETRPKILWNTGDKRSKADEATSTATPATATTAPSETAASIAAPQGGGGLGRVEEDLFLPATAPDLEQVRQKIRSLIGVDPFEATQMSKKQR